MDVNAAIASVCGALVTCTGLVIGYLKTRDRRFRQDAQARIRQLETSEAECLAAKDRHEQLIESIQADVSRLEREVRDFEHINRNLQATVIAKQEVIDRMKAEEEQRHRGGGRR